jgi:uncharacterized protein YajQ (UPF0234 family)
MNCQIQRQPDRFRIADKPNPEQQRSNHHHGKCDGWRLNLHHVLHDRPATQRHEHGHPIADDDMWQEITRFPHEVVSAVRATFGTIEVSAKQLTHTADGASKAKQAGKLHITIIITVMPDNSFDVVSVVDMPEVLNAIQQTRKEVQTRFDLKDSKSQIELNEKEKKIVVQSIDDFKLKAVVEIIQQKLAKRKVPLKNFIYGPITPAAGSTARQEITIQSGIPIEKCKEIVKTLKDSKIKVQGSIQGDLVRVSGKSRDLLQEAIQLLRSSDFGLDLQFTNYRTF